MDLLAGTERLRRQLDANIAPADIIASWQAELGRFHTNATARRIYN